MYFTITPKTTEADLRKQYEKLAIENHPDKFAQLGPDEEKNAKTRFQDMQQEYFAALLKLKAPGIDYDKLKTIIQGIIAGIDTTLQFLGKKPLAEMLPDQAAKLIETIKIPAPFDKYKPMIKLFVLPNANPEAFIDLCISVYKLINKKK